ncbi:MAG: PEP-CTERM sorting domain-containing protein [Pseudomonadota bacterium]
MRMMLCAAALSAAGLLAAGSASATIFNYDNDGGTFGNGGSFSNISSSYNDASERLTWVVDDATRGGASMDGAWLVLSDGPNPKRADVNELAIFYMDFVNDRMAVYAYNGLNDSDSWRNPAVFLGDYSGGIINTGTSKGFSINAGPINSFPVPNDGDGWEGARFGANIGIWFHPVFGLNAGYNGDGSLNEWSFSAQTWLDINGGHTTVDEPSMLVLMGAGFLMLGFARRRRS